MNLFFASGSGVSLLCLTLSRTIRGQDLTCENGIHIVRRSTRSFIAQLVEHRTVNPCVPGSSPGEGATNWH